MRAFLSGGRAAVLGLATLLAAAASGKAAPVTVFNADVNEWSSSTQSDPTSGIYPIGGTGALNGGFVVTTGSDGAQIGIRASLRFKGLLPQTNNGSVATYFAPAGTSGNNLSLWNFDGDIDLQGTGHTLNDYTAVATFTDRKGLVTPVDLLAAGIPSNLVLGQTSENPGFAFLSAVFPSFDPNAPGVYTFDLKLTPKTFTGDTLEATMNVDVAAVPEPGTLALAGVAVGGLALRVLRRKKVD
jgi:PEP-CTERM motif